MEPHESLRGIPTITLAQGGASSRLPADSDEAFTVALRLGASGIHTTARLLADGTPVVSGRASAGGRFRSRSLATLPRERLPPDVVTLEALLAIVGPAPHLLLHVGSTEVVDAVVHAVSLVERTGELWLASDDLSALVEWRPRTDTPRLLLALGPRQIGKGAERLASELRSAELDGLGLFHTDWTPGLVATLNRFGRCTFGWGAEHERELARQFRIGLDAVSSAHPDRLAAVAASFEAQPWVREAPPD